MSPRVRQLPDVTDGIVWHPRTGPWLYVRVDSVHYDTLTDAERIAAMVLFRHVLSSIGAGEGRLLVVNQPRPIPPTIGGPRWRAYAAGIAAYETDHGYTERVTYLGARLNARRTGEVAKMVLKLARALKLGAEHGGVTERNQYVDQADGLARLMAGGGLAVHPASVAELRRLQARPWYLDMDPEATDPERSTMTRRAMASHLVSDVDERFVTCLVADPTRTDPGDFPGSEWLAPDPELGTMPELFVPFLMVRASDQARTFDKARDAVLDQIANMGAGKVGLSLAEQRQATEALAHAVRQAKVPWVRPGLTVTLTAPTLKDLSARAVEVTARAELRGVYLFRPKAAADQRKLLVEQEPGAPWRARWWAHNMPVTSLAVGMPHAVAKVGDEVGPYRGHTVQTLGRWPVRFDHLTLAARNISPIVAVLGKPGSGKSALTKTLGYESALRGARILWLDPPGETDPVVDLMRAAGVSVRVVSLDDRHAGTLSPWTVWPNDPGEAAVLAVDMAKLILGGTPGYEMEAALAVAADRTGREAAPSWDRFLDHVGGNVGEALRSYLRGNLGQLIGGTGGELVDETGAQVTVVRYVGLTLPQPGLPPTTVAHRLSLAVLHASAALMLRILRTGTIAERKLAILDEAHQLTRSDGGRALVLGSALTIRKSNGTLLLTTQNAAHLGDAETVSTVSTVFAHRCEGSEAADVARVLLRPDHEGLIAALPHLGDGEVFMRDAFGRVARVQLDIGDAMLWEAVQTTPPTETAAPTGDAPTTGEPARL